MNSDCDASGQLTPTQRNCCWTASRQGTWAGDLAAQGFAAESTDALEVIPAVTGSESSFQGLTEVTPVVGALFLRNYEIKGPTDRLACAVTEDVLGGLARE